MQAVGLSPIPVDSKTKRPLATLATKYYTVAAPFRSRGTWVINEASAPIRLL